MKSSVRALSSSLLLCGSFTVQAQFTEVDITPHINKDLNTYSSTVFPSGCTQFNVAGVPFGLTQLNSNANTLGVIQSPVSATNTTLIGPFSYTFSVPAGTHATVLYCLINSVYGASETEVASIVVTGANGETATLSLVEGVNIRDYNNALWVNTVSDSTVVSNSFDNGARRLDCQRLILPATFAGDTIASISFQGYAYGEPRGSAFLVGLTLSNALLPVPSSPILGMASPIQNQDGFDLTLQGPVGSNYEIRVSTDLATWSPVTNFVTTSSPFYFRVLKASNPSQGFYRAVMP